MKIKALLTCALLWAGGLAAQVPITESALTPDAAAGIIAFYNSAETILNGESHIAQGSVVGGSVALLDGTLTLAGRIGGQLLIINGDLVVLPGGTVDGNVTVVGGTIRGAQHLEATAVQWYRDRLKYELRDGQLVLMRDALIADEISAGREFGFGRTDLLIASRGAYNRSEGLPVHVGPRLTLGRANPTLLEGLFIFRTAAGFHFDEHDYGYALRAEQFLGGRRAARIGVQIASETVPIETWGLSDREASLAAFVLHRDYRDHYMREGWSAYVASGRRGLPLDWRVEFASQRFHSAQLRDPYSIFDNPDPWRREVGMPEARLNLLRAASLYDTRNENRDPSTGWLIRAEAEHALSVESGSTEGYAPDYRYGLIDLRRYARLSPYARVSLRVVAAGSLDGEALPPFRQQALGGEGSLPGYERYEFDCGGHDIGAGILAQTPFYGCDRLALLQLEYQSNFRWLARRVSDLGRDFGLLENVKAVLFFDAGRAWTEEQARGMRGTGPGDFVADAGVGVRFGGVGAYWAFPLSSRGSGANFFVRYGPRL